MGEKQQQAKEEKLLQRKRQRQTADGLQLHMLNVQGTTISSSQLGTNLTDSKEVM
jgi:hypothetical protein